MAFFEDLKISLRQKWLRFFQANRSWLNLYMDAASVATPDGGKRPASYLILGVINALEPQVAQLMLPFSKLNPDVDSLIEVLELNFDPNLVLENSPIQAATEQPEAELSQEVPLSDAEIAKMLPPQNEGVTETITVIQTLTQLSDMPYEETSVSPQYESSQEEFGSEGSRGSNGDVISRLFPNF
ncbi:DUF5331 domain-containing protein [Gloeocapsopsis dulcis]|uniref:DUF5331 domain-containing protein n=1 Tax=Gloeocapsopsis dulcis TaxID=2859516 RepID=UPI00137B2E25|nr:DUF5331 domain-containing protein [Gloeocapsopsis dulcis]WNN91534.1 DUF5331 domain-containing protein [Gloeocapsopsis dulcis]